MSATTHADRIQQELAAITQPLVDHYEELDRDITAMQKDIIDLRKARTQLRNVLRGIDPSLVPTYHSNGKKKKPDTQYNNEETLGALTTWMQEHRDEINAEGGVHASGILDANGKNRRPDFNGAEIGIRNQSKLSAAMRMLHEQGVLRLDHTGNGGAKFYKVV